MSTTGTMAFSGTPRWTEQQRALALSISRLLAAAAGQFFSLAKLRCYEKARFQSDHDRTDPHRWRLRNLRAH